MRKLSWITFGVLALIVVASGAWLVIGERSPFGATRGEEPSEEEGPAAQAMPVELDEVRQAVVRESAVTTGEFSARDQVVLTADAQGLVRAIEFQEGNRVEQGQLLLRLDDRQEEARLAAAAARRDRIARDLERARQLAENEFAAEARVDELEAQLAEAEAEIEVATTTLEDRTIEAPFAGWIGLRQVSPGSLVTPGTPIAELWSIDPIDLAFSVPANLLSRLRQGQGVIARGGALPGGEAEGEVRVIENAVDPATRTVRLQAAFENPDGALRPGAFVNVELVLERREEALLVPEQALIREGNEAYLFTVGEDDRALRRTVATGEHQGGMVEITDGLEPGARIVIAGQQRLRDGQPVRPLSSDEAGAAADGEAGGAAP